MRAVHAALDAMLADIIASGGSWDPAATYVAVYTAIVDKGVDTLRTDLTMPDVAQYPRTVLTAWGTPYRLADGSAVVDGPEVVVAPPDDVHPVTILGYAFLDAATAGNLKGYTPLPDPVTLNLTTDHWTVIPRLRVPANGSYEVSVTFNG